MIYTLPIFTLLNVILAFIDSRIIRRGNRIYHGLNGALYIGLVATAAILLKNYWLAAALLCMRLVVFNISLNLFRGLSALYISPAPTAITDKLARYIFRSRGTLMYGVYTVLLIITTYLCVTQ